MHAKRSSSAFDPTPSKHLLCKNTLELTLTNCPSDTSVETLKKDGDPETDMIISFSPPLSVDQAAQTHVSLIRLKDTRIIFAQYVFPLSFTPEYLEIQEEELNYALFPVHQLHVNRQK